MAERKELQEKILTYRILESRLDALLKQREMAASKLIEIQSTLGSMDEIEKSKEEIIFPMGAEAYTLGKITDKKKLMLDIGAGIILEKTVEEAKQTLSNRKADIESTLNSMQKDIGEISSVLEQLGPEIQEMSGSEQEAEAG